MLGDDQRALTEEEDDLIPIYFYDSYISLDDHTFFATWNGRTVTSMNRQFPWVFEDTGIQVTDKDYELVYPNFTKLQEVDYHYLHGRYHNKVVSWSFSRETWLYKNNRRVVFDSEESEEGSTPPSSSPDSDKETQEVSQLLESATQSLTTVLAHVSQPSTLTTVPGALPSTPGPSTQPQLPTPRRTQVAFRTPVLLTRSPSPSQARIRQPSPVAPSTGLVNPRAVSPQTVMANPPPAKMLGSPPEPFEGKSEKVEAFWNTLENYYYLNGANYVDEQKKISSALTYFKISMTAREWAQDRQKTALAATPVDFGTWADFKAAFKKHFIPEYTKLEATNAMYTSKMGGRPFNEWYQEWSTYTSRSRANDETKMFAFRKALPQALHQKIIGVSPQPTTLEGLAEKAREFDCIWRLYSNPSFTNSHHEAQQIGL